MVASSSGAIGGVKEKVLGAQRAGITRIIVPENARLKPGNRIDQQQCGHFPAADHEITDAEFEGPEFVDDALVDALVVTGNEQKPVLVGGQSFDAILRESLALGREQNPPCRPLVLSFNRPHGVVQRLTHHHHSRAAAKRSIVDPGVLVVGEGSNVVDMTLDDALLDGSTHDAGVQDAGKHLRKQCENIETHAGSDRAKARMSAAIRSSCRASGRSRRA